MIAQGVSDDKAVELCMQTPMKCHLLACLQEATDSKMRVHLRILERELKNVTIANAFARQEKKR